MPLYLNGIKKISGWLRRSAQLSKLSETKTTRTEENMEKIYKLMGSDHY
jgi:predicted translin family RNA/ssDNA-binding protein